MDKNISNSYVRTVATVTPRTTIAEAAELMRKHHIGALVVVDDASGGKNPSAG